MKKFRNKYRIPSARLPGWDYRNAGSYFITICTQNRAHFFGECQQGKMKLSTAGMIAQGCWYQIPYLNPQVHLGAFVVMPNHVHGVLILDDAVKNDNEIKTLDDGTLDDGALDDGTLDVETFDSNVSTSNVNTNHTINHKNSFYQKISPKSGSVSRIIQQYKTVCTKHIRKACPEIDFEWQSRFYDHIIRDANSFKNISNYILNNPKNWIDDKFHTTKT